MKYIGENSSRSTWHNDPDCDCFRENDPEPIEKEEIPPDITGCVRCTDALSATELHDRVTSD